MKIVILGAGGVGGYLGAKLWKAGHDLIFVARGAHLQKMSSNGLKLISKEGNILVNTSFTDKLNGYPLADLVIITVKSFDTVSAASLILPVMKDDTLVLSFQNGVENEEILTKYINESNVLLGVAYIFSTIGEPGVIIHHGGVTKFKFGEYNNKITERCQSLEKLFLDAGIDAKNVENIILSKWEKFIFICGLSGMTAYTKKSIGEILKDPLLKDMLYNVVKEAILVGRAKLIDNFNNFEEKVLAHYYRLPYDSTSSMYYDLVNNKKIELDALNGTVVKYGRELNIPTPFNEKIYNSLKAYA